MANALAVVDWKVSSNLSEVCYCSFQGCAFGHLLGTLIQK